MNRNTSHECVCIHTRLSNSFYDYLLGRTVERYVMACVALYGHKVKHDIT